MDEIFNAFHLTDARSQAFGAGLINRTWKVEAKEGEFILQRINDKVFKQPADIAYNIRLVAEHLQRNYPGYFFIAPLKAANGDDLVLSGDGGWYRLFPFAKNGRTYDVVDNTEQAYEAAKQFGRFTRLLSDFDAAKLKPTITSFHDLGWRYQQFLDAIEKGNIHRKEEARDIINELLQQTEIVEEYTSIRRNPEFRRRVTHHDTKISNVLFDQHDKGLCVIDLDTLMPGYFISDVGDMMRTYLSPVNEEERDFNKIVVRPEFFKAIVEGYREEMKNELTEIEARYFLYAGKFMIYMQALRFLTDHLNNDVYYGAKYEGQNLMRATNQTMLLRRLVEMDSFN